MDSLFICVSYVCSDALTARVKNDAFYLTGVCWVVNLDLVAIDSLKFSKFETYQ